MSTLSITGPCVEATRSFLADSVAGFNAVVTALGFPALTIDWSAATSKQFFEMASHPDFFEESAPFKYPMCFLHGLASNNIHEQFGVRFSGNVDLALRFYAVSKAPSIGTAGRQLESIGNAVESAVNTLFCDGNWPQNYGVSGVLAAYPMTREPIQEAGEEWRQGYIFRLSFESTSA
jgi:hypothetical protein